MKNLLTIALLLLTLHLSAQMITDTNTGIIVEWEDEGFESYEITVVNNDNGLFCRYHPDKNYRKISLRNGQHTVMLFGINGDFKIELKCWMFNFKRKFPVYNQSGDLIGYYKSVEEAVQDIGDYDWLIIEGHYYKMIKSNQ